jgi:hypothetical protein
VHAGVVLQPGYDGYLLGAAMEMAGDGCEHKLQCALTTEIEASALRSQAPVLPCYQRLEVFGGMRGSQRGNRRL